MDALTLFLIIVFLIIFIFKMLLDAHIINFGEEPKQVNTYKGDVNNPNHIISSEAQGQVEEVCEVTIDEKNPGESEALVRIIDVPNPVRMKAKELVMLNPFEALAGRTTTFLQRGLAGNEVTQSAIREADILNKEATAAVTRLDQVLNDNKELAEDWKTKVIRDAKTVGSVRKLSGNSFAPFGSSFYGRRRQYGGFGGISSLSGIGGGEDSEGGDDGGDS